MKVFISWSGQLSHAVASILRVWLPNVIQAVEPFVSSEDLQKGTRWFADISRELDDARFGIVCLTAENMNAPWLHFEAGAISKAVGQSFVTPLLIDLSPSNLQGPFVQFQATTFAKDDMHKLIKTINQNLGERRMSDMKIESAFEKWWVDLDRDVKQAIASAKDSTPAEERRTEREILEEILQTTRALSRAMPKRRSEVKVYRPIISEDSLISIIKRTLEERGHTFIAVALDEAASVRLEEDELVVEYAPNQKHLRDNLARLKNIKILREVGYESTGRAMGLRLKIIGDEL